MKIEVALPNSASQKERGDLLEQLAARLLKAQSYEVQSEVRLTAVEVDLLCTNIINGKKIYVECKAYRDKNIDAPTLHKLLGVMVHRDYAEAWIISTAEFGKDAKGFVESWQAKDSATSSKMSFYTPEKTVNALVAARVIEPPPVQKAKDIIGDENLIGDWVFLVTQFGEFWITTVLSGGIPKEALGFYAKNSAPLHDSELITRIKQTDTSINGLNFVVAKQEKHIATQDGIGDIKDVASVQTGDAWSDYRPARPKDFVGRTKDLGAIFEFFRRVIDKESATRIFAITGDSGMGKSSLIAKIKHKTMRRQNQSKYFAFPVDVRAATSPSYVLSALIKCLVEAQKNGFGNPSITLAVTDLADPINSPSIKEYLHSVEAKGQLIALIFDQFEELYSKPEHFGIFTQAKQLLLNVAAAQTNLCLGFAWKSDSTTHSDHPAYFFWHSLSDYRITKKLEPFSQGDSIAAINIFEKELGEKLHGDLRHNLLVSSQGYPWLLKKLCIHIYDKIQKGDNQAALLDNMLGIESLFDSDLKELSHAEKACLEFVANRAPVDWFEVIDISGPDTLSSLIHRRLIVRSGDRLNVYWDIFREYILTRKTPIIPLRYLPSNEYSSVMRIAILLDHNVPRTIQDLQALTSLSEGTLLNIGSDMNMFGIINRENGAYTLHHSLKPGNELSILRAIREKFKRHALLALFKETGSNHTITPDKAEELLRQSFPNSSYSKNTWHAYTVRLCKWFELCGLLVRVHNGFVYKDIGDVTNDPGKSTRSRSNSFIFTAPASPEKTVEVFQWIRERDSIDRGVALPKGYRNPLFVLARFRLISIKSDAIAISPLTYFDDAEVEEIIKRSAAQETILREARTLITSTPNLSASELGRILNDKYGLNWKPSSQLRNGRAIKDWAEWVFNASQN